MRLLSLSKVVEFGALLLLCSTSILCPKSSAQSVIPPTEDRLGVTFKELTEKPEGGFVLLRFNGKTVEEEPLEIRSSGTATVKVGPAGKESPQFTFRIDENRDYLALHLVEAKGDFAGRNISLAFRSKKQFEAFRLDYMGKTAERPYLLVWPYLWNPNTTDPLGSFAIIKTGSGNARDRSLAAIWAEGTLPHPDLGKPWTSESVNQWVAAYQKKFTGVSSTTLSATNNRDLYQLTDWLHSTGDRVAYLHTDTWRGEYWPVTRSLVDVNPAVFPGGREDLKAYRDYLEKNNMLMYLHSVSGGIGRQDPEFVLGGKIDSRLATWVKGRLEADVNAKTNELLFRPDPNPDFPQLRLETYWNLLRFRVGNEVVKVANVADVDKPVWRLTQVERGCDKTPLAAHKAGEEVAGFVTAYGQNYIPDNQSDLLSDIAFRFAKLINEAGLDQAHFDGPEIHRDMEPWGFEKFSWLVFSKLNRAVTSTCVGTTVYWNFESQFNQIRTMKELGYFGINIPVGIDGQRNATSWLDANYEIADGLLKGARRLGFGKPEPMFGISTEILNAQGLMPRCIQLFKNWQEILLGLDTADIDYLHTLLTPVKRKMEQAGQHFQSYDVPVLEKKKDGYYFVPTRILPRDGVDAPWISGQEFGPVGPRQYLLPGETVTLTNPYAAQPPDLILHVLPALGGVSSTGGDKPTETKVDSSIENYNTGVAATQHAEGKSAASATSLWPTPASLIVGKCDTGLNLGQEGIDLTAKNPTTKDLWEESALPSWNTKVPLQGRRGLALDVVGDGSGAVLVLQFNGSRDYVVKIDFTGARHIVIPNGEASWSADCWGWRMGSKSFNYNGTLTNVRLGFGFIPPKTSPHVVVKGIELLENQPGLLVDPVVNMGSGKLSIQGEVHQGEYLTYNPTEGVKVFDSNWKFLRSLVGKAEGWSVPNGNVKVSLQNKSADSQPWLELQVITRGEPYKIQRKPL